jgi:hypothetical protein
VGVTEEEVKVLLNNMDALFKRCNSCKKELTLDMFHNSKNQKYGKHNQCKLCRKKDPSRKEYAKKWASENKELKSMINKRYRIKNAEKIKEYTKTENYKLLKFKSYKRNYEKNIKNPNTLMAMRIRTMISKYAKSKTDKTFQMLGYSNFELVAHLEKKFVDGMSWDNYGKKGWHIDQIKPLASNSIFKDSLRLENALDTLLNVFW